MTCPVVGCSEAVAHGQFMCRRHWPLVSRPMQDTLWFLANNGKHRDGFQEALESAVEQASSKVVSLMNRPRPLVTYKQR